MNLHEYQSKQLFAKYGLPVPQGIAVETTEDALEAIKQLGGVRWVVKAQVHAGGRGKAGGVQLVDTTDAVCAFVRQWIGQPLVTYQTDEKGKPVSKILIEECSDIGQELYLGAVVDRSSQRIVFMASTEGGVEIEKVAEQTPEKILKRPLTPLPVQPYQGRELAFKLGLQGKQVKQFTEMFLKLAKLFEEQDLALMEVDPLVITKGNDLLCLDAKSMWIIKFIVSLSWVMRDRSQKMSAKPIADGSLTMSPLMAI